MGNASSVDDHAHDLAAIIDPYGFGSRGARNVYGSEGAIVQEKPMAASRVIRVVEPADDLVTITECANDLTALTDPKGLSTRGAREIYLRNIDLGEIPLV